MDVFVETKNKRVINHEKHHDVCYSIGSKNLIKKLYFNTGGGGTNTAVSFSRLGLKTGWLGVLGNDHNSKLVEEELKREHVKILGPKKKGSIGYSVILFGLKEDRTILTYKGLNDKLLWKDVPKINTKWFYVSSMMGESFITTKKLISETKKQKKHWAVNLSSYLARQGIKKMLPLIKNCDLLILNRDEASLLTKTKKSIDWLLKKLQVYAKTVVITEGKKGATAYDGIKKYSIKPRKKKVVETTGAGDAFASGVVAGVIKGKTLQESLKIGLAQAESVISYVGAKNKLLTWREIKKII